MKTIDEIRAERLRTAITESCCDACGAAEAKGKKTCCPKNKDVRAQATSPSSETGQDIVVRTEAKEAHTHPFIKRCVAAITKGETDRDGLSRAFAICTAQKKRSPKAAAAKKKEGVPADRMSDYESALAQARKKREDR